MSSSLKWFHGNERYFRERFKKGKKLIFSGEVRGFNRQREIVHADVEFVDEEVERDSLNFKRIVPIYSETEGLYQKTMRKVMKTILDEYGDDLSSPVPDQALDRLGLIGLPEAFRNVHFPGDGESMEALQLYRAAGHRRIIFDEFFFLELGMALRKKGRVLEEGISFWPERRLAGKLIESPSFSIDAGTGEGVRGNPERHGEAPSDEPLDPGRRGKRKDNRLAPCRPRCHGMRLSGCDHGAYRGFGRAALFQHSSVDGADWEFK